MARAPAVQFRRRHSFGGSPFGPAGKARPVPLEASLGDQLDRHGLVLNCDKVQHILVILPLFAPIFEKIT